MTTKPAGRINKPFGTDGGLMLSLYDSFPEDFDPETTPVLVTIDGLEVPLWCDRFERRGTSGATAAFADFDTERRIRELLGREFRVEAARGAEEDESDFEDLIGFEVEAEVPGTGTVRRGTIAGFLDHEANPLFELDIDGRTALVPAVEEFVARTDFEGRTVHFVLPEGLLELE